MRRLVTIALVSLLLASACSDDGSGDDDAAPPTTASTSSTASTTSTTAVPLEESLAVSDDCSGIGALAGDAELTFVRDGRIWSIAPDGSGERCLAEFTGPAGLQWGGDADRLLAGEHSVLFETGPAELLADAVEGVGWSRPTGRAVLARDADGQLTKISAADEPPLELLQLPLNRREVLYHPAGTAIAGIEAGAGLLPNVWLASNRGEDLRWLLTNETAEDITDIAFAANGDLLFVAVHDGDAHVHRLVLGDDELATVIEHDGAVGAITASPYAPDDVAAARGDCDAPGPIWVRAGGVELDLAGTAVELGTPVGWTPDGSLAVLVRDGCGDERTSTGDLYLVRGTDVELVAEGVNGAAVRAPLPPPPPPPPAIEAAPA